MSKVGGPTGQPTPPVQTTQSTQQSTQTQESKNTQQSTQTGDGGQSQRASEQEARSRRSEQQLTGQFRQAELQQQVTSGPTKQGQLSDPDGTGRVTRGPDSPQTIDVTRDPSFQALPEATRTRLQNEIGNSPDASARMQQVVNHPLYNEMNAEQRTRMLNVFANTDANGRESLPTLMNRRVVVGSGDPPPTAPALLTGDNTRSQTTLLDNLNNMANQPLNGDFTNRRGELMGRVIQETAEPTWRVDQGVTGTCAPTTVQAHLLQHSPSEYARIIGGLASPSRSVQLADGSTMTAAQNQAGNTVTFQSGNPPTPNTVNDPRSVSERMFQSAVKQHAERATPPVGQGPGYNLDANQAPSGLWDNKTGHVMSAIYNRRFEFYPPPAAGQSGGQGIDNFTSDPATRTTMRNELYNRVQNEINSGQGPVPVHIIWGNPGTTHGLHELNVERIENGRVYFRNPWGSRDPGSGQLNAVPNYSDGQNIAGPPPRRVEDSQSGMESMTEAQFRTLINGATIGPPVGGA